VQSFWPWHSGVLDPQGPIGAAERLILLNATTIMLAVVVPVILLTLGVAWWFRAGNPRARYLPDWEYSGPVELVVWSIPALVVLFLGGIAWIGSHDLDPPRPIASKQQPIDIQVVALDWKWLFIYPQQGVASVNRLVVPAGVPLQFSITSATVMNSFFVPQLGSQIYAMAGMATRLNLQADKPGTYPGISAQFSGDGFSDMRFEVVAVAAADFEEWLTRTKAGGGDLDAGGYSRLSRHGTVAEPATFARITPNFFDTIMRNTSR
jgi:cytochrome o ubiquinol oxidase subunit 2